jgi:hypothetical protein
MIVPPFGKTCSCVNGEFARSRRKSYWICRTKKRAVPAKEFVSGKAHRSGHTACRKCIALLQVAAFDAAAKPPHPLLGAAVRETLGHDVALRPLLHSIVADLGSGVQPFFDVSLLQDVALAMRMIRPDPGEAICL